jgi:hypothetical protein
MISGSEPIKLLQARRAGHATSWIHYSTLVPELDSLNTKRLLVCAKVFTALFRLVVRRSFVGALLALGAPPLQTTESLPCQQRQAEMSRSCFISFEIVIRSSSHASISPLQFWTRPTRVLRSCIRFSSLACHILSLAVN